MKIRGMSVELLILEPIRRSDTHALTSFLSIFLGSSFVDTVVVRLSGNPYLIAISLSRLPIAP